MNFFKDPKYKSLRIVLLLVIIVVAGYFVVSNFNKSDSNQGMVYIGSKGGYKVKCDISPCDIGGVCSVKNSKGENVGTGKVVNVFANGVTTTGCDILNTIYLSDGSGVIFSSGGAVEKERMLYTEGGGILITCNDLIACNAGEVCQVKNSNGQILGSGIAEVYNGSMVGCRLPDGTIYLPDGSAVNGVVNTGKVQTQNNSTR